ncbi:MAG: Hpt domain-containing protein, partial [Desulfovermiculus sp.]
MSEALTQAKGLIEEIAEELVMFDASDSGDASGLSASFDRLARLLENHLPRAAQSAAGAAERLWGESSALAQTADQSLEQVLSSVISALQSILIQGRKENEVDLPFAPDPGPENGEQDNGYALGVDHEMLSAYVSQQIAMLSDLEELILAYEQGNSDQPLVQIKRLVHTAKGEAGVMGLTSVAQACHDLEDHILEQGQALSPDTLLDFKDWFESAVQACCNRGPVPEPGFLSRSEPGAQAEDLPGECEGQGEGAADADAALDPLLQPVPISDPEITAEF